MKSSIMAQNNGNLTVKTGILTVKPGNLTLKNTDPGHPRKGGTLGTSQVRKVGSLERGDTKKLGSLPRHIPRMSPPPAASYPPRALTARMQNTGNGSSYMVIKTQLTAILKDCKVDLGCSSPPGRGW